MRTSETVKKVKATDLFENNGLLKASEIKVGKSSYEVVHPLFDIDEEKIDTDAVAPMDITKSVKWSLISLRVYLIVMVGLSLYRSMELAGIIK